MKRLAKVLAGIAVVLLLASASCSFPRTLRVESTLGTALYPAYLAHSYIGSRLNPVDSGTYWARPLALAKSDASGRIDLPFVFHLHRPFPLETPPRLSVEFVYVPQLHNAMARVDDGGLARVEDFTARPEAWEGSLRNLSSLLQRLVFPRTGERPLRERDPQSAALARELILHFSAEYEDFLRRYEDVPRTGPTAAMEPTWGILVTRLFSDDVTTFQKWAVELK
jgi:hypothetical protein